MKEIWKDIKGYEGIYQVSDLGRVKSLKRYLASKDLILKTSVDASGYPYVNLCIDGNKKTHTVHQLGAIAFLDHVPCGMDLVVDHINFDRADNRVHNLRIISPRENCNRKHLKSSSKYTGVSWDKTTRKWRSQIYVGKKRYYLGRFRSELEASMAYEKAFMKIEN